MPGLTSTPVMTELNMSYNTNFADANVPDAYTRLILDVLRGQQAAHKHTSEPTRMDDDTREENKADGQIMF